MINHVARSRRCGGPPLVPRTSNAPRRGSQGRAFSPWGGYPPPLRARVASGPRRATGTLFGGPTGERACGDLCSAHLSAAAIISILKAYFYVLCTVGRVLLISSVIHTDRPNKRAHKATSWPLGTTCSGAAPEKIDDGAAPNKVDDGAAPNKESDGVDPDKLKVGKRVIKNSIGRGKI